ncbi:unnamed protein product [Cunninghamella blakesleeana]
MKVFHLLFIFILNFKLIFCQSTSPQGPFIISNFDGQLLTAGSNDPYVKVINQSPNNQPPNDNSKWMIDGNSLINVGNKLVLQVNGDLKPDSQIVTAPKIQDSPTQYWYITPFENGYTIASASSSLVLESYPENGDVFLMPRDGDPYQKWFVSPAQ